MADKLDLLKNLDEKKFKKLKSDRENWLNKGKDVLINTGEFKINNLVKNYDDNIDLVVSAITNEENKLYKTLVLKSKNDGPLPFFNAGQKISLTFMMDGKYYTKSFHLSCDSTMSKKGQYSIVVKNDNNDIYNKYLFENAKIGEVYSSSLPFGDFYYNKIRDCKKVMAIVSDKGIIPIYSMAQSILSGVNDYELVIYYSVKHESDLLFKNELINLQNVCNKIKINYVLSEEEKDGFLSGFVSADRIKNEMKKDMSIFISGGEGLLKYLDKEISTLNIPNKYIRYDSFLPNCNIRKVQEYTLSIYINDELFETKCYNNKTIMQSIYDAGIYIPSKCGDGSCGFCNAELACGQVKVVNDKRLDADKKYNFIHPCTTYPLSDIDIIVR